MASDQTSGDRELLDRLIREEWPKLRRFFRTKAPDTEVLDLVQATLLAFVERRDDVAGSPRAYLWGIARKQVLKLYERHRPSEPFDSMVHRVCDADRALSSRLDERHRLLRALHELPFDHQVAFELRYGEDLSLEEVAAALSVSLATAKRYIAAALERLRGSLGADLEEAADAYGRL